MLISLGIGGYKVSIEEPRDRFCFFWPLARFEPFLSNETANSDITVKVHIVKKLAVLNNENLIFDSGIGYWKLYDNGPKGYLFESCRAENGRLFLQAAISHDLSEVEVTVKETRMKGSARGGWGPATIISPLLEFVLQEKLARDGGVMLHSSAILAENEVLVFFGPSGAGKSTAANFFLNKGYTVLNDERVIIRREGDEFKAYGTPWPGSSFLYSGAQGRMRQIFKIGHGQGKHMLNKMSTRVMMATLFQEAYLPHWTVMGMDKTTRFFEELATTFGSLELLFCKSSDIVDFLTEIFF